MKQAAISIVVVTLAVTAIVVIPGGFVLVGAVARKFWPKDKPFTHPFAPRAPRDGDMETNLSIEHAVRVHLGETSKKTVRQMNDDELAQEIINRDETDPEHQAAVGEWKSRYKADFRHPKGNLRVAHHAHVYPDYAERKSEPEPNAGDGNTI